MSEVSEKAPHAPSVTKVNFEEVVLKSDVPVLVDFWAPWCPPCRAIGPSIDALAVQYAGKAKVVKLDVDDEAEIESRYGVKSIPTLIFFKNGDVVGQLIGAHTKTQIAAKIDAML